MKTNEGLNTERFIEVTEKDLPLHCPTPEMSAWNAHPRVFLPVEKTGEALCPYCGTLYKLKGGACVGHGH
jgi:uncharacterized Zn-finger protein